ncbi:MAG: HEAT repeat domain-containing protein, partial [Bacteroidales bacterium]|nr:HEAT repeat domain-containing protein [Bacteroidales bacterium]
SLGDKGTALICEQVVQVGTGDDTRARYAISSLSSHLSKGSDNDRKGVWEKQCLRFMKDAGSYEVRLFFMRQMNLIGSDVAVEALSPWVNHEVMCSDAVMALQAIGTDKAQGMLASTLAKAECPCASQIMVALAASNYSSAVDDYIRWYERGTPAEKSAALGALAASGRSEALPVLTKASENAGYKWERTGAVSALLLYAEQAGMAGDKRTMDKITRMVMSKSNTGETAGQRLAAMSVIVSVEGEKALPLLLDAVDDPDIAIRGGVIRMAAMIPGEEATKKWISRYDKVRPEARPEILFMLGQRGDPLSVPLLHEALKNPSAKISAEAVAALARIEGTRAVDPLLAWILTYESEEGHWAAVNALRTILDKNNIGKVVAKLPESRGHSTVALLWLLGWSGDNVFFKTVVPYAESDDLGVRAAAFTALKNVAGYNDQETLIAMLERTDERPEMTELSNAIIAASMRGSDPLLRSEVILAALDKGSNRQKLIPLLAETGGEKALKRVAKEFENGSAEIRDACFDALDHWSDPSATSVLLEICASGNKTFERLAFDAYLRLVTDAAMTRERKMLLMKDIAPLALAPDEREELI